MAEIDFFHDVADPYSHLLLRALPAVQQRYAVTIRPWLVGPPEDGAAPDRPRLATWSLRDAVMLGERAGIAFPARDAMPPPERIADAAARLTGAIGQADWLDTAIRIGDALWQDEALPNGARGDAAAAMAAGQSRQAACRHYLGGTLHYGGETYWGLDRLHYLEARLRALALANATAPAGPVFAPPSDLLAPAAPSGGSIDFFLSFRSPYSWLATERVARLAAAHGATLNLRFLLPMVMRSLPVPQAKRRYITLDAAREARRLGVPFGKIVDPVGRPVERGYSLLPWAREQGRGLEYCVAFLRGVWAEGIDAASDAGLARIVANAGLDWAAARRVVDNDDWRAEAEANRAEMLSLGLWGVPSFRTGDTAVWGQDRLWVIDAALRRTNRR